MKESEGGRIEAGLAVREERSAAWATAAAAGNE